MSTENIEEQEAAERQQSMQEALAEYKAGRRTDLKVHLLRKENHLDGPFWEWWCYVEYPNREIRHGYIQSDGHSHALETFVTENDASRPPVRKE